MNEREPESGYFADYHNVRVGVGELKTVDGLQPDQPQRWQEMSTPQRLEALQEAENRLARVQGRPPEKVVGEPMGPGCYGYYDPNPQRRGIYVNTNPEVLDDRAACVDTVAHEGRHAYQDHALANPGFHPEPHQHRPHDPAVRDPHREVQAWDHNLHVQQYQEFDDRDPRPYMKQPVERDSGSFGTAVAKGLYPDYEPPRDLVNDYNYANAQNKYGQLKCQSQQPRSFGESFGDIRERMENGSWTELSKKPQLQSTRDVPAPNLKK